MFCADKIAQPCNGFTGISKVAEFVLAIKGGCVPIDMVE
jgi:hypothetical protein